MSQFEYKYLNHVQHPYKPGNETFTFTLAKTPVGSSQTEEVNLNVRISDTLIGQWDLDESIEDLIKAMYIYLINKRLKTGTFEDLELNAYETPSPNSFPYKRDMESFAFPPTESLKIEINPEQ